jgi:hypothetical protein
LQKFAGTVIILDFFATSLEMLHPVKTSIGKLRRQVSLLPTLVYVNKPYHR